MRRLPRPLPTNPKMVAASADRLGTAMDVFEVWLDNRRAGSLRKQVHYYYYFLNFFFIEKEEDYLNMIM